jgi:hypothetical protein
MLSNQTHEPDLDLPEMRPASLTRKFGRSMMLVMTGMETSHLAIGAELAVEAVKGALA